ncbi:GumC family protein [Candidatus Omnitrophota bacterium]
MIQKEQSLQSYFQVIIRRRWVILTFFAVLVTTVVVGTLKQTPIFSTAATLMIERSRPNVISVKDVSTMGATGDYVYKDYYETQYKLVTSPTLLRRVIKKLDLAGGDPQKEKLVLKQLIKNIKVAPVKTSQLVKIRTEDSDPVRAAEISNVLAKEYIMQNLERNIESANEASRWLSAKIQEQRIKLVKAELNIQQYRKENNIDILPEDEFGDGSIGSIKSSFATAQAMLANYSERYTDEHPKVIELKAQVRSLKNRIHGMEDISMSTKTNEYRVLEGEVQTSQRMYEVLLARMKEVDMSSTLTVNNISIIDKAEIPERPIKPNVALNIVLSIMVGLMGGVGLGFFIDYLDTTIKTPQDIKDILESRFLGGIPEIEEKSFGEKDKIVHLKPTSPIAESYRQIRTEILSSMSKEPNSKTMLVTSAEPQAGKTTTSVNIAIALSQKGKKVLLVDTDLRKPQIHKIFNLNQSNGVCDYVSANATLDSIIKFTDIENLKIVTSGKNTKNPSEIIGSERMDLFLLEAKDKFDYLVFDTPPVISVTDAVILAGMVDAVIQVIRSGKIIAPVALRVKERLESAKANVLGVVLNGLRVDEGGYGYYYYKYYRYYGDGEQRKGKGRREAAKKSQAA